MKLFRSKRRKSYLPFTSCLKRDIRALCTASRSTFSSKQAKYVCEIKNFVTTINLQNEKKKRHTRIPTAAKELPQDINNFGNIPWCIFAQKRETTDRLYPNL
jgi:chloramphenicol O-acetyltransferase